MIEISNVSKFIDKRSIFEGVNLKVEKGSIFGLVGTNGAGKTSLIKCIMGLWTVDKGFVKVRGFDTAMDSSFRNYVGYVSDDLNLPSSYSVNEAKKLYGYAYEGFDTDCFGQINEIYKIPLNAKIRELSKGMGAKVSIMLNLSLKPDLMVMDEPFANLDPISRKDTIKLLLNDVAQRSTTIFISSHNLADIEKFCDTFGVMDKGSIKFTDSIEDIKKRIQKLQVVFPLGIPEDVTKLDGIKNVAVTGKVAQFYTDKHSDKLENSLKTLGASIIETVDIGLDEIFLHIMEDDKNEKNF